MDVGKARGGGRATVDHGVEGGGGGLEGWRAGGLEEWRAGGLEEWRAGGLEVGYARDGEAKWWGQSGREVRYMGGREVR